MEKKKSVFVRRIRVIRVQQMTHLFGRVIY